MHAGTPVALRPFGIFFILDMLIRTSLGERWAPSLILGGLLVRRQASESVGVPQKAFAWSLGFVLALASCATMGLLPSPAWVTFALCGLCLTMLFVETAFGVCIGCHLQPLLIKTNLSIAPAAHARQH